MKNEWSNGGGGRRRRGGSRGSNTTNGNTNNKAANTTSNTNAPASTGGGSNNRGGRRKANQNTQRTNQQSIQRSSNGSSQRPANARNMTGANAATTNKTRSAASSTTVNVPKEASKTTTKVEAKTIPTSYAAAASTSTGDDDHHPQPPTTHTQNQPEMQTQTQTQNQSKPETPKAPQTQQTQPLNNTKLADSTILASNYVPEYLKEVLYLPVQHGYQARKLPDMLDHCNRTYFEMVPHPSQLLPPPSLTFPTQEMTMVPLDPFFALRPETKQRRLLLKQPQQTAATTSATIIPPPPTTTQEQQKEQTTPQPEPSGKESKDPVNETQVTQPQQPPEQVQPVPQQLQQYARIIPKLENAKGREDYFNTFRLLLQEEFEEKMILYERYTQFDCMVKLHPSASGRAILHIPGLSNTRPALEPGDEVMIRPQPPRAVQQLQASGSSSNMKGKNKIIPEWNFPMLELHAQVVHIVRGTWKKGKMGDDKVIITWLDPQLEQSLLLHQRIVSVRFLPSAIHLQRTLEALKWMERLHPTVIQQLLFPTETPQLPITTADDGDRNDLMLAHQPTDIDNNNKTPSATSTTNGDDAPTAAAVGPILNEKQSRFVHMVLKRTRHPSRGMVRPPMILTGPAGTGKTKALLTSIIRTLQQDTTLTTTTTQKKNGNSETNGGTTTTTASSSPKLPKKHILVCAPSHTACDVITRRLSKSLSAQQLFRLYPSSRSIEMVPAELLPYVRMKPNDETEFILPPTQELMTFEVIVCTCSDAHILTMAGLTNSRLRMRRQHLHEYALRILQAGNMQISGEILGAGEPHFTHLFIDEAAQATEPESLIPLSVVVDDIPNSIKVEIALAGDPRQLSPDVYSPLAAGDLQKSLLERLLRLPEIGGRSHMMGPPTGESWTSIGELIEYSFQKKEDHDHLSVFLTTSYRGHPSFLMMPSKLFYFDKLRSAHPFSDSTDNIWCKALRKLEAASSIVNPKAVTQDAWPIHFRGVVGKDQSTAVETFLGSNSWSNPVEANEIVGIVQTLVSEGISTASIGIMGAFRGQVILIRRLLRAKGLGAVNVGIVEDYQAVERDVIIVSLTRSNSAFLNADIEQRVGLFRQAKRMNVALTRAENLLVVVGDPTIMEQDEVWKQWLEFCHHHGFWYGTKSEKSSIA